MPNEPNPNPNPTPPVPPNPPPTNTPTVEQLQEQLRKRDLELTEARTEADAAKKQLADRQQKDLEEQGNYKEANELLRRELTEERERTSTALINNALTNFAEEAGISDSALVGLIPREGIKVENGVVTGAKEAVAAYKNTKPLLFQRTPTRQSTGSDNTPPPTPDAGNRGADVKKMNRGDYGKAKETFVQNLKVVR